VDLDGENREASPIRGVLANHSYNESMEFLGKSAAWIGRFVQALQPRHPRDPGSAYQAVLNQINNRRSLLRKEESSQLQAIAQGLSSETFTQELIIEAMALSAEMSERILGLHLFDVQLLGALIMADGKIAEMQTGEGKTLAAVPAVYVHTLACGGVHVLTANDYLAKRDANWMGEIYRSLGLSVSHISQDMSAAEHTH
jgi:preprotein translocase subunit SecA